MRSENRTSAQLRPINITRHYTKYAEGSVLIEFGGTKVLCTASIDEKYLFPERQREGLAYCRIWHVTPLY